MRSLTAAIRTHCLDNRTNTKDPLLAFFLACESKLKRNSQQEWNKAIEHEIRRMVGLESLSKFVIRKVYNVFVETVGERQRPGGLL
jgi:hypothetical protein